MSKMKKESPLPEFCKRFSQLRTDKGMNQADFAKFLGISRPTVGFYENGDRIPDARTLAVIAQKCGVTADYLIGISGAQKAENSNAVDKYGLSESALTILADCFSRQKHNSITLTLNAMIENRYVLGAISKYLYYNLKDERFENMVPYHAEYRYRKDGDDGGWGNAYKTIPIDAGHILEAIDNQTYKRILLLDIQEQLLELLKEEDKIDRLNLRV